ncbi:hypothetical protein BDV10DRAFT_155936 [Aspergillus recurvatus]
MPYVDPWYLSNQLAHQVSLFDSRPSSCYCPSNYLSDSLSASYNWYQANSSFLSTSSGDTDPSTISHSQDDCFIPLESSFFSLDSEPRIDGEDYPSPRRRSSSPAVFGSAQATKNSVGNASCYPALAPRRDKVQRLAVAPSPIRNQEPPPPLPRPEKPYRCDACGMEFSHRKSLDRHKITRHTKRDPRKICPHGSCNKSFSRQDNLIEHRRRYHGDLPARAATLPNPNPSSESSSPSTSTAITDARPSSARHPISFVCSHPSCARHDNPFRTISDLRRHQRSVHHSPTGTDNDNGYLCASKGCPRPDKKWSRLDNLRNHIYKMHGNEDTEDLIARSTASKFELFGHGRGGYPDSEHEFVLSQYFVKTNSSGQGV